MAGGMTGRLEDAARERAHAHQIALAHGLVDLRNSIGLRVRRHHPAAVALLELLDAAGVIVMMMGHQNVGEPPAGGPQRRLDGGRFRRIDGRGRAAFGIMQEDAEIVLEAREKLGLGGHGGSFTLVVAPGSARMRTGSSVIRRVRHKGRPILGPRLAAGNHAV